MHENQRRVNLLEVLVSYAPDNVDVHKLRNDFVESTALEITGSIYDGLAYGNWPWTSYMTLGNKYKK